MTSQTRDAGSTALAGGFDLARLRAGIKPFRLHWFPRLRSTSDHAAKLRRQGKLFAPAMVLTGRQIAGRGRGSNTWWSSGGVLTVTFALPVHERFPPQELPLVAGLAVRKTAADLSACPDINLKWPNDVLHDGRKLAGLLCERVSNMDLVGVGLNVNLDPRQAPRSLRARLTSLAMIRGQALDMTDVLVAVARQLHHQMRRRMEQPFSAFVREYSRHDALIGKTVTVTMGDDEPAATGRCVGIDSTGRLMVRNRGVVRRVVAGHVIFSDKQGTDA